MAFLIQSSNLLTQAQQNDAEFAFKLKTQLLTTNGVRRDVQFHDIADNFAEDISANFAESAVEKPILPVPTSTMTKPQIHAALSKLGEVEKNTLLSDLSGFIQITPEQAQHAVEKVFTEESKTLNQVLANNQQLDETDYKQIALAIQVIIGSSFFNTLLQNSNVIDSDKKSVKSIEGVKEQQFVGIISSDIMLELLKIVRKVVAELNISDRRISADFLTLNAKMVEAAADSTIKEGKEMFNGALTGFFTSLAITAAGTAFQARGLHKQNQSIKHNLVKANQNGSAADRLNELNASALSSPKNNSLELKTKDGVKVELADQATPAQQALANQRGTEAAQRTNKLGLAERDEHERVMNKTRTQIGIAEQGSRMSDNAGQMVTSANQVNVKSEEANKMTQQSVADMARTVSADKDKQVDKSLDLVKQMIEYLREIRESQLRTFQSMVRG
ncbi:IpaC/SipC family type III secretion system effector [Providencia sp. PROV202]|uniref:IpaC/SipC family type III secretion system effector n=1 Tax=Providencia sp. PROV202 TaxID=2949902 RepID=UPI00234B7C9D|nr:IpaC/SipC family type III secretion system effector [Providencia sp. PROV202]